MRQTQRILIIDDSKEIVTALKAFFERKYEVITASDGIEGLLALEQNRNSIDPVISDLLMPELDGLRVISHLKKSILVFLSSQSLAGEGISKQLGQNCVPIRFLKNLSVCSTSISQ